ncbi:uncharacterized protein LOC5509533 isoform X2 [Nematostella vectensis]|uniref:uncharacterized protein LOC5509533 isoform X2 n=1 Tax=Nematostella vectensis TaxID=45351 RepID=UPI0020774BB3|nr:uncharacterized protein LOC5509533 isoform X2 [Nematostella vectensis]
MHKIQGATGNYVFTEENNKTEQPRRRSTLAAFPSLSSPRRPLRRSSKWTMLADDVTTGNMAPPLRRPPKRPSFAGIASKIMDVNSMNSRTLDKEIMHLKRVQEAEDRKEDRKRAADIDLERRMRERAMLGKSNHLSRLSRKISKVTLRGELLSPIDRFRKIVRLLCFLLKIKSSTDRKYNQPQHTVVFEQLQELAEAGVKSDDGMAFDPNYYKAVREIKLSQDAVQILSMSPGTRTDEQLQGALVALKASVPAFGEYPLKMQQQLVKVGWYESFEAKRVIIRQGHPAENFYFILSGTALVTLLFVDPVTGEQRSNTVAVLGKGSSFGELALLHHKTRSATVLCKEDVALLAVGREDFRDIFMSYEDGKEPDHIQFLRTVPYLKGVPLDQCLTRHDLCIFHYFRRGVVIVKNSSTEWIYIIKSGSCRVLTNLEKKKAMLSPAPTPSKSPLTSLPAIPIDETERRRVLYTASGDRRVSRTAWSPDKKRPRTEPAHHSGDLTLPAIVDETERFKKTVKKVNFALPWIERLNQKNIQGEIEAHKIQIEKLHRQLTECSIKSVDLNNNNQTTRTEHVCVQIEVLKPKDQFGLSEILHDNKAVKCHLVSNGAECILIKKSWFLQVASDSMLRTLRGQISPYPSQDTLEQNLQDKANWESYKTQTISNLLDTLQL